MNECEYAFRLGAYHDGELSPSAAADVDLHLGQCPACTAELARLAALSDLLASGSTPELSAETMARLHRNVGRTAEAGIRHMAEVMVAAAAAILIICTVKLASLSAAAGPNGAVPLWEMTAISRQEDELDTDTVEQQIADWTVLDLARKNGHD